MPLLSIVTINLNNKDGLLNTLQSIKSQTFRDFQLIVVDGVSNDGSIQVIEENQSIIDHTIIEKDTGIYNAMNKGIKASNGKYIYFLNSGDILDNSNSLNKVFLDQIDSSFICTNFQTEIRGEITHNEPYKDRDWSFSLFDIYSGFLCHQAFFIKREIFELYGLYNESLKVVSDWELFFIAIGVNKETVTYRDVNLVIYNAEGLSSTIGGDFIYKEKRQAVKPKISPYLYERLNQLYYLEQNEYIVDITHKSILIRGLVRIYARILRFIKD